MMQYHHFHYPSGCVWKWPDTQILFCFVFNIMGTPMTTDGSSFFFLSELFRHWGFPISFISFHRKTGAFPWFGFLLASPTSEAACRPQVINSPLPTNSATRNLWWRRQVEGVKGERWFSAWDLWNFPKKWDNFRWWVKTHPMVDDMNIQL